MTRLFYLFALSLAALSFIFLAAQPTVAHPPAKETGQEGQPDGTPQPDSSEVDWANARMEGEEGAGFPHSGAPDPHAPVEPEPTTPPPPDDGSGGQAEPDEGAPPSGPVGVTPAPGDITHVVRAGETLYEIGRRFGISPAELVAANNIQNPRRLQIGQVLNIPGPGSSVPDVAAEPQDDAANAGGNSYTVRRGDSPYEIARRFGVSVDALITVNQIPDPRRLIVGQVLTIPGEGNAPVTAATPEAAPLAAAPAAPGSAGAYVVQRGDTLYRIARSFSVTIQELIEANNLTSPDRIMAGQTLTIPGTTDKSPPESSPPSQPEAQATPTQPPPEVTTSPTENSGPFIWPISLQEGWIAQWYRSGHPAIDVILPTGTPIQAAAGGTVEFSGWNNYGFGHLVVIDHGNGHRTLYAHQSERLVATGDTVAQGDTIGLVGSTGYSTHPHLHFEIRQEGAAVNPCGYLPGGCQQ